jgi:capsular polysaccharide transport system permease protein
MTSGNGPSLDAPDGGSKSHGTHGVTASTTDSGDTTRPGALAGIHAAALERAAIASEELRRSARSVRLANARTISRTSWAITARIAYQTFSPNRRSRSGLFGFLAFFATPAALAIVYFSLIASSLYTSEARFAVRGGARPPIDAISALTGLASLTQVQDSLIVVNYVKSQALVEALDRQLDLRAIFGRVDWISRFNADDPIEDLVKYWKSHIKTSIEAPSGIVTMRVSAFSPEEALRIANATVDLSERLVNGLSARARQDAVTEAEAELVRAETRLTNALATMRDLRNQQSTLDPQRTAEGIGRLISELRLEKIRLEQELTASERGNVSESAPQVQIMRTRVDVIGEQITGLEQLLTSRDDTEPGTIAGKITRFDAFELEQQIAEKQYTLAAAALERARVNAEGKHVYLATFVHPVLPRNSTYPNRVFFSLLGIAAAALLYAIAMALWRTALRKLAR